MKQGKMDCCHYELLRHFEESCLGAEKNGNPYPQYPNDPFKRVNFLVSELVKFSQHAANAGITLSITAPKFARFLDWLQRQPVSAQAALEKQGFTEGNQARFAWMHDPNGPKGGGLTSYVSSWWNGSKTAETTAATDTSTPPEVPQLNVDDLAQTLRRGYKRVALPIEAQQALIAKFNQAQASGGTTSQPQKRPSPADRDFPDEKFERFVLDIATEPAVVKVTPQGTQAIVLLPQMEGNALKTTVLQNVPVCDTTSE